MGVYTISYHFHDDARADARRDSLMREIARCDRIWNETTSFALVETAETLPELEARLYLDSELNSMKDRLLVIALTDGAAIARGIVPDRDCLRALLPRVSIV